ncbi:hypothetical protein JCM10213v2_000422 [Rhodosporidiobolus nylandii]
MPVAPRVSLPGQQLANGASSGGKREKERDWGKEELLRRKEEILQKAQRLASKGGLRIELSLETAATMPALESAKLPTHKQHLRHYAQHLAVLPGTQPSDYLVIFSLWAQWTADSDVATFPISGALVALFLVDKVPVLTDRPRAVFILEQYRKATAAAFENLGGMSIAQLVEKERNSTERVLLGAWTEQDWAEWKKVVKAAKQPLAKWKAIQELAPAAGSGVHVLPSPSTSTPSAVAGVHVLPSTSLALSRGASPSAHGSAAPTAAYTPNVHLPSRESSSSAATASASTTAANPNGAFANVWVRQPGPGTQQPATHPPAVPANSAAQFQQQQLAAAQAAAEATVKAQQAAAVLKRGGAEVAPVVPQVQAGAREMSEKARGKMRAVDPDPSLTPATPTQQVAMAPAGVLNAAPVPQAFPSVLQAGAAALHAASMPGISPSAVIDEGGATRPVKRRRTMSKKAQAAQPLPSRPPAQLPPAEQDAENAFYLAAAELQDAMAEYNGLKRAAAVRAAQPSERSMGLDLERPYGDFVPLSLSVAIPGAGSGVLPTAAAWQPGISVPHPTLALVDPLNCLRTLPPRPPLPPHHLLCTASPLPTIEDATRAFALVPAQLVTYPAALQPHTAQEAHRLFGLATALGQDLAAHLPPEVVARGGDERERSLKKAVTEKAHEAIRSMALKTLPDAREPEAARRARETTERLLRPVREAEAKKKAEEERARKAAELLAASLAGAPATAAHLADAASAPPAPAASTSSTNKPTPSSATSGSPAAIHRPLHRPSLSAVGSTASAPAVPSARPRADSNGAGMRRRPSIGGADVHPLAKIYASASEGFRTMARQKAAEIRGVPTDELANGLAVATSRMSASPLLGGVAQLKRLPGSNGNSPAVGSSLQLANGAPGHGKSGSPASARGIPPATAKPTSEQPRMASPPLVPIPLATVEENGGTEKQPAHGDVEMANGETSAPRAEPPLPKGSTALGMIVESPNRSTPPGTPAITSNPAAAPPSTLSASPSRAAAAVSSAIGSAAQAAAGAVTAAAQALPSLAGLGTPSTPAIASVLAASTSTDASPSTGESASPTGESASPSSLSRPYRAAAPTSLALTPTASQSNASTATGRAPKRCGVCGSSDCPGRGGRQWCLRTKEPTGQGGPFAATGVSPSTPSSGAKGKGREVAATLLHAQAGAMPPPPLPSSAASEKKKKPRQPRPDDGVRYPSSLRRVPKAWLAVSDPVMPFSKLPKPSKKP